MPPDEHLWPWRSGYISIKVPDVETTASLCERYFSLQRFDAGGGTVGLRGGVDHHWLLLKQADEMALECLAFEVSDETKLDRFSERLGVSGVPVKVEDSGVRGIGRRLRFDDPAGNTIELFANMTQLPVAVPRRRINSAALLHGVLRVPDIRAAFKFYSEVLGFRASDWIEDGAVFLRASNGYHHSLALVQADNRLGLDHVCFVMESLDDVMRIRALANADLRESRADVQRHSTSGSISYYVTDETSSLAFEACCDHLIITDESSYRPRVMLRRPDTVNMWLAGDDGPVIAQYEGNFKDD